MLLKWSFFVLFLGASFITIRCCEGHPDDRQPDDVSGGLSSRMLTKAEYNNERRVLLKYKNTVVKHSPQFVKPFIRCLLDLITSINPETDRGLWNCCKFDFFELIPYCRMRPRPSPPPLPPMTARPTESPKPEPDPPSTWLPTEAPPVESAPTITPKLTTPVPEKPADPEAPGTTMEPDSTNRAIRKKVGAINKAVSIKTKTVGYQAKRGKGWMPSYLSSDPSSSYENISRRNKKGSKVINRYSSDEESIKDSDMTESGASLSQNNMDTSYINKTEQKNEASSGNAQPLPGDKSSGEKKRGSPRRIRDYRWARLFKKWQGLDPQPKSNRVSHL